MFQKFIRKIQTHKFKNHFYKKNVRKKEAPEGGHPSRAKITSLRY
jgi:hypothetical protein